MAILGWPAAAPPRYRYRARTLGAGEEASLTVVELVRHAKAGVRDGWHGGPDRQRPLSEEGRVQARKLVDELIADGPLAGLYSSPMARCVQTLEPLADKVGLDVVEVVELAEAEGVPVVDAGSVWVGSAWLGGRALQLIGRLLDEHAGGRVVCCSHGDVIPAVLAVLAGRDGLPLRDVHLKKGGRMRLRFDGRRCVEAVPHPPPSR